MRGSITAHFRDKIRASRTVDEGIIAVSRNLEVRRNLAEQRNNSLARVAANDRDGGLGGVIQAGEFLGEGLGADNVQGSHTEQALGVKDAGSLEDFGGNGDGGVDGVGDDKSEGLGAEFGNALDQITHNSSVDLEEVVTGHTRLACTLCG